MGIARQYPVREREGGNGFSIPLTSGLINDLTLFSWSMMLTSLLLSTRIIIF